MSHDEPQHERRSCTLCHLDPQTIRWMLAVGRLEPATIRWILGGVACILITCSGVAKLAYDTSKRQDVAERQTAEMRQDVAEIRRANNSTQADVAVLKEGFKNMTAMIEKMSNKLDAHMAGGSK